MKFNYNLLNNCIAQVCGSQQEFARRLGISFEGLQEKMCCSDFFTIDEMNRTLYLLRVVPNQLNELFFQQ